MLKPSFFAGILATLGIFLPAHVVTNNEVKLTCMEMPKTHRIVTGESFLGLTVLCERKTGDFIHAGYKEL